MLETSVIQTRGFRNVEKDGEIVGFELRVRSNYYRGAWLSLLRPGNVTVDGEVFKKDEIVWCINGIDYTPAEMLQIDDIQWPNADAAVLKIKKPGGLSQGYHEVDVTYNYIMSYIPPSVNSDEAFENPSPRGMMRQRSNKRRLLLV